MLAFGLSGQLAWAATPIHTEIGDAGPLPATSQTIVKSASTTGDLTEINGSLGAGDQEDLYRICVTGNSFSATTSPSGGGSTAFDSQLFLFSEAGAGVARGHVANDDIAAGNLPSTLPPGPNVPVVAGAGPINYPPGIYYLGISSYDHDPRQANGGLIFPNNFPGVVGPNAGAGPLTSWVGPSFGSGAYKIKLTGAAAVISEPCGNAICAGPPPPGAIVGTNGHDVIKPGYNIVPPGLQPTAADDIIFGLGGNDVLEGGGGNDIICGGTGNDLIYGGAGNDVVAGGDGVDTLYGDTGDDVINGGTGVDNLFGGDGDDTINGVAGSVNNIDGGNGSDTCINPAVGVLNCNP